MARIAPAPTTARTRLSIRVAPGSRRPGVVGRHGDMWRVRVAAPPEHGRANDALVALLAVALAIPQRCVAVVTDSQRRDKIVELAGITSLDAEHRLAAARQGSE
jgi:uncharacterized protein